MTLHAPRRALRLFFAALALAGCSASPTKLVAAYDAPAVPPPCRDAVYADPKIREIMVADAGSPALRATNQNRLAFLQDEAVRNCLRARGELPKGGVEPVRYQWYRDPF